MKSQVVQRSILIAGYRTSVTIEDDFWTGLKEIAAERHMTLSALIGSIDVARYEGTRYNDNLSSAIRLFVLAHYRHRIARVKS